MTLLAAAVSQARQSDAPPDVTVWLRNATVAAPGSVDRAKMMAKSMFAAIGVNLAWREAGTNHDPDAAVSVTIEMTEGSAGDHQSDALAEAYPFAGGAKSIVIRYDRVRDTAGLSKALEPLLLGHVIVHELAHVLQCVDRHSDSGIMKARWTPEDYYEMRWKPMSFSAEDIELIHLGMDVLRSHTEATPAAVSPLHTR